MDNAEGVMTQQRHIDVRMHQPIESAASTYLPPVARRSGLTYRRIDRPSYAIAARRYLRVLGEIPDEGRRAFFADLRNNLEGALARLEHLLRSSGPVHERLEAEIELEWRCNQCEHWLGPAATASVPGLIEFDRIRPSPTPDATDLELAAVGLLWRTVGFLGRWRRPTWHLSERRLGFRSMLTLRLREAGGFGLRLGTMRSMVVAAFRRLARSATSLCRKSLTTASQSDDET